MRDRYEEQIKLLYTELEEFGRLVEMAIQTATTAVLTHDKNAAKEVAELEELTDKKEKQLEALCMRLILEQAPVATDLRRISSVLKMITDMERIGDQAEDITELITHIVDFDFDVHIPHIKEMADVTKIMVNQAITAYVNQDMEMAEDVIDMDDTVDNLFLEVKKEVVQSIKQSQDGVDATDYLMIAKYFERIGDHATNIAEWARYAVTGEK